MKVAAFSLRARLFRAFALVTLIAVALPAYFFRNALQQDRIEAAGKEALAQAAFVKSILDSAPSEEQMQSLFAAASGLSIRITLTDPEGGVLRDSHVDASGLFALDNHMDRPEMESARVTGTGISQRFSNTLGFEAAYAAVRLENGDILRLAVPLAGIRNKLAAQLPALLAVAAGVAVFCLVLSAVITGKIRKRMDAMTELVDSIARGGGKKHHRLHDIRWREMLPLASAVNHMADTIEKHVAELTDKQGQLETILDSMREGVLVLGPGGGIRRWNKALVGLFPDMERAKGRPVIEGIPLPALQSRVDAVFTQSPKLPPDTALHFEMPAGRFLVAHVSRPATRNDSLGAVIVIYDATEIMRLERVRRDFVSNVSHELRTPLTVIAGYAETLAAAGDLNGEYAKFAAIIHKHAVSLAGMITDLLALARIEDDRQSVQLEAVDAGAAAREAVAAIRERADAKDIDLRLELAAVPVLANARLLTQVFRNLLENACRYSPQKGVVRLNSRREGGNVLFCVSDNGPGIHKEDLPRIFERLYQVQKERNSGTAGIGLALCKHIIERHNGSIWAESPYKDSATAVLFTLLAVPGDKKEGREAL